MKSDYLILLVVSMAMLLKLAFSTDGSKNFDSEYFENTVQAPLQCATFFCLTFYLFKSGQKKDQDLLNRGGKFGIPLGLLMTAFKNASSYNMSKEKTFANKMVGLSILYGSFVTGSLLSKSKGLPIDTVKKMIK